MFEQISKKAVDLHHTALLNTHLNSNTKNIPSKQFPPYSRQLERKIIQNHFVREIWVITGDKAWQRAKNYPFRDVLVLPPESPPENYNWEIVSGFEVLGIDTSGIGYEKIKRLAYETLKAGALKFRIILPDFTLAIFSQDGGSKNGK